MSKDVALAPLSEDQTTEVHHVKPKVTCTRTDHVFARVSGTEVRCQRCPVGYQIGPGVLVQDGKLLIDGHRVT